jgi:cytochrome b pre-mRNA-processing protein 3
MIRKLFRRNSTNDLIDRLHGDIVAVVRQPTLYLDYGVADTFEGRFEALVVFVTLVARRLEGVAAPGPQMAQDLIDSAFRHLDIAMREFGVSDIAVPKRMKRLAGEFAGRSRVYGEAVKTGDRAALADALSRNLHNGRLPPDSPEVERLVRYVLAVDASLAGLSAETLSRPPLPFPAAADTAAQPGDRT